MNKKITLIQENTSDWHWTLLVWDNDEWVNVECGLETSFEVAVLKAKEAHDNY
jgi:hypothetical protein